MRGIDVSENNGTVDWPAVAAAGQQFAIVRLGYGNKHLDSKFYANINGALAAGLKVGIYYYSYALTERAATAEAEYVLEVLRDCGLTPDKLAMGCWYDMEDADGYKERHGMPSRQTITNMCSRFIVELNKAGYSCGIYANLDWLRNKIYTSQLADYVPYWCAQWGRKCDWPNARIWQYTDSLQVDSFTFDGNFSFRKSAVFDGDYVK